MSFRFNAAELTKGSDALDGKAATRWSISRSVVANVCLTIVLVLAGLTTGSQALVADGIHLLLALAENLVKVPGACFSASDERHESEHKRYERVALLVLGLLLLTGGTGLACAAVRTLQAVEPIANVGAFALWAVLAALVAKEVLFRWMLAVAHAVRSRILVANAWRARTDIASSVVVAIGVAGNLAGTAALDPIAAVIVGFMVCRKGWGFLWDALHDLAEGAACKKAVARIVVEILSTPGVRGFHDLKARRAGNMILVDVHLEVDGNLTVQMGHDIALQVTENLRTRHPVLSVMAHVAPITVGTK